MAITTAAQPTAATMFTGRHRMLLWAILAVMLIAGLWLRLYHITDPPLDFHPQRQYWDANRARLLYYQSLEGGLNAVPRWQMVIARANADISTEVPIIETLAVAAYRVAGGENLALPRGISAALYVIGGLFLFLLALRLFSPLPAFVALGYYLFLPFAVQSTRTFQPDPLMTASICASLFFLYRYTEQQTLARLLAAAPFVALALLAKPVSIFFTVIPFAAVLLSKFFLEKDRRQRRLIFPLGHVAVFCGILLLGLAWTLWNLANGGGLAQQAEKAFVPELLTSLESWGAYLQGVWGGFLTYWALAGGLLGIVLCRPRPARPLLIGGWVGFAAYLVAFNYHVQSHIYYNLPMVPVLALSLAALVSAAYTFLTVNAPRQAARAVLAIFWIAFAGILLFSIWKSAVSQVKPQFAILRQDYEEIGDRVGHTRQAIFLALGYGDPLRYHGMIGGGWWPAQVDLSVEPARGIAPRTAAERLREHIDAGREAFIVDRTMFGEFEQQPELMKLLTETYPIIWQPTEESPYLIYDLRYPFKPLPVK